MAEIIDNPLDLAPRLLRATPFALVVFCFLLAFFSLSSCSGDTETDATGFQIVAGTQLIKKDVNRGPVGPDEQAQSIAAAARPWVALTLIVVAVGGSLMVTTNPRWRGIRAIAAGLALCAWVGAAIAADDAVPKHAWGEFSLEVGFGLPLLILVVTCVHGVWTLARAHDAAVDT